MCGKSINKTQNAKNHKTFEDLRKSSKEIFNLEDFHKKHLWVHQSSRVRVFKSCSDDEVRNKEADRKLFIIICLTTFVLERKRKTNLNI